MSAAGEMISYRICNLFVSPRTTNFREKSAHIKNDPTDQIV